MIQAAAGPLLNGSETPLFGLRCDVQHLEGVCMNYEYTVCSLILVSAQGVATAIGAKQV